jgi:hypothetical protein
MDMICRSGNFIEKGYEISANKELVTVFSAYSDNGVEGGVLRIRGDFLCAFEVG